MSVLDKKYAVMIASGKMLHLFRDSSVRFFISRGIYEKRRGNFLKNTTFLK